MLEAVLTMSHSIETYTLFDDPALVHGCIKLMADVKVHGRAAPFSYHYGYLAFRILIIALGACILGRTERLDETLDAMGDDPETELILIFSAHVAETIEIEIDMSLGSDECDWILGWNSPSDDETLSDGKSASLEEVPLVSKSDTLLLLNMLWEDRTAFLTIARSMYTTGISAVMFLLWRYVHLEESSKLWAPFSDLLWRSCLTATSDQHNALVRMNNDANEMIDIWDESPKIVNIEDSRALFEAYNNRLTPADTPLYQPIDVSAIPILLRFVVAHYCPGSEDLFPVLIGVTMERFWTVIESKLGAEKKFVIVASLGVVFEFIGELIENMCRAPDPNRLAFSQILETFVQRDLVGLMACGMLYMKPTKKGPSEDLTTNLTLVQNTCEMLRHLWTFPQKPMPEKIFAKSFPEWRKTMTYFEQRQMILNKPRTYASHFQACVSSWHTIGMSLGQLGAMDLAKQCRSYCTYARCHDPTPAGGVHFTCSLCLEAGYCSVRCQKADWVANGRPNAHKALCSGRVRAST